MRFTSSFTLFFTLLVLGLAVVAAPIPTPKSEEKSVFNLSGRVVDKRVGRALKHFKPKRPTPVAVAARHGYDHDKDNKDKGPKEDKDGYEERGPSRTKEYDDGEGKDGSNPGDGDKSPKYPKPSR